MNALGVVAIVLAVLVGIVALKLLFWWLIGRVRRWLATRHNYCEFCYRAPRSYICNIGDNPPTNICQLCVNKHVPHAFLRAEWLKSGKLTQVPT